MWGAFTRCAFDRCIAGSPSRRPGNFLLRGQKKVTKEEALNRTPAPLALAAHCNNQTASGTTRPAALSLLSLSPAPCIAPPARLTRGCTPCSRESQMQRRSGDATGAQHPPGRRPSDAVSPVEHGVQPRVERPEAGAAALVIRSAARAKRFASARNAVGCSRAPLMTASRWCAVQRLFFGDFLLAPQKKVTRPPGRNPGTALAFQATAPNAYPDHRMA
jgi:hypothetical protein